MASHACVHATAECSLHRLLQFLQQNLVEHDVVLVRKRIATCNRPTTNTLKKKQIAVPAKPTGPVSEAIVSSAHVSDRR